MFASRIALYIVWCDAGYMFGEPLRLMFMMFVLSVYRNILSYCYQLASVSFYKEALRMRPRPSRLARNEAWTHIHALRTFTPMRKSLRDVKATCSSAGGSCLFCRREGCAVLARLARALAGEWACCALGREGRACLLVLGDRQVAWERVQCVLWALGGPPRTVAGAFLVL